MVARLEQSIFNKIRASYIAGQCKHTHKEAAAIGISRNTFRKYVKECKAIEQLYPKRLADTSFRIPRSKKEKALSVKHLQLLAALPALIDASNTKRIDLIPLHYDYRQLFPDGFGLNTFTRYFIAWRRKHNVCLFAHKRVKAIGAEDMIVLQSWKNGFDHTKWERATVIMGSFSGKRLIDLGTQLDRTLKTMQRWIDNYKEQGIAGLIDAPYTTNKTILANVSVARDNIVKLLHETPQLHGFNRASWRMEDLAQAYRNAYNLPIAASTVGIHLKNMGFGYKKSREVLTSPDKKFREKLDHIKAILSHLQEDEKFFSIDEYGHFSVKLKGGRTYVQGDERKVVPQLQKSKGFLIVTAALELSTNQVTHFYSRTKDTGEMISLIDLLLKQYATQKKLYLSWDAATWHRSKKLTEHIHNNNTNTHADTPPRPIIELAPLPSSAQFLNVIEAVFGGLARAVIHNSDYVSLDACKSAIDIHFSERNAHFKLHPRKAGNKLWGRETVKAVFDETNNCKSKKR